MRTDEKRKAIIIQARTGSTRLPGKVLLDFYNGQSILEIIIQTCTSVGENWPVVVATSLNKSDDAIEVLCANRKVVCYRGEETDVLKRFIGAAETCQCSDLIRVCADNPLLDAELLKELASVSMEKMDYCSFEARPGVPSIKSHWGIFAERVTLSALKKAVEMTDDVFYHEHVTNFIYGNPDEFSIKWLESPPEIRTRSDIRFTIDTPEDFMMVQRLYSDLADRHFTPNFRDAIVWVDQRPEVLTEMKRQIEKFSK